MVISHSSIVGNVGFGDAGVTVPETGTYRTADNKEARHYNAGDKVSEAVAEKFQIVPREIAGAPESGDQLAAALAIVEAAGYTVTPPEGDDGKQAPDPDAKQDQEPENKQAPAP